MISLLGPPHLHRPGGRTIVLRSRKHLALLAYLAVEHDHPTSRDTLLALLWPDANEEAARNNLRVVLADLRRLLGEADPPLLQATRHTVHFDPASNHTLAVTAFRALLGACRRHAHESLETCVACVARLDQAAALYTGEFLAGFVLPDGEAWEEWALLEREHLHQAALATLATLAQAAEHAGDHAPHRHQCAPPIAPGSVRGGRYSTNERRVGCRVYDRGMRTEEGFYYFRTFSFSF